MTTIAYDQPVLDLISDLNATGHITHGNWPKTMVTFHHNGGIFTAQQVLDIWKTRPASAHFDVDKNGQIAQFAGVHDYAWACANAFGNETSISIEMSNSTTAPDWLVAEDTWQAGARLAGWLFANIIHAAPTSANVVFHKHWYATDCAGPYMDTVYPQLLAAVQASYSHFTTAPPSRDGNRPPLLVVDGYCGVNTLNRWAAVMGTHTGVHDLTEAVQTFLNARGARDENGNPLVVDGICDLNNTQRPTPHQHTTAALQRYLGTPVDCYLDSPSTCIKALQTRLNHATTGSKEF